MTCKYPREHCRRLRELDKLLAVLDKKIEVMEKRQREEPPPDPRLKWKAAVAAHAYCDYENHAECPHG